MKTFLAAGALLVLAAAGCSSSDAGSDTPDPAALASSIAARATSPAAGATSSAGADRAVGDCEDGRNEAAATLTATIATDIRLSQGCAVLSLTVPDDTETAVGVDLCTTAAGAAFRYGVASVVVSTPSGTELARAEAPTAECTAT